MPVLSRSDLINGVHGKGGGYRLGRSPKDISVGEILRLTEGDLAPVSCLECNARPCERTGICRTLPMWKELYQMINAFFDGISLQKLMKEGVAQIDLSDDK